MYHQVVRQCTQNLAALEGWLDKAEQYAIAKKFDVEVLLNGRLAPDQQPFIYQVQSACDYVKRVALWSGAPEASGYRENRSGSADAHPQDDRLRRDGEGGPVRRSRGAQSDVVLGAGKGHRR